MKKLGRGLDALIDSGPESIDKTTGITTVNIDYIKPNKYQPRRSFNKEKIRELAKSLTENGMIQPIIVTKKDNAEYELIAGERRLEAAKLAGLENVPVIIRSVSQKEQLQFAIIENVQREDLNAVEEARAYYELSSEFSMTHAQISDIVGKDRATITNSLRLLKLDKEILQMIAEGKIFPGHARAILQVDEKMRLKFARLIYENKYSVRKAEIESKRINQTGRLSSSIARKTAEIPYDIGRYENFLQKHFKTKVKISNKNNKGKVVFYYKSKQELDNLIDNLKK